MNVVTNEVISILSLRVTLVERGSPNSLCLLESGKVSRSIDYSVVLLGGSMASFCLSYLKDLADPFVSRFSRASKWSSQILRLKACAQTRTLAR